MAGEEDLHDESLESESESGDDRGDWEDWESGGDDAIDTDDCEPAHSLFSEKILSSPEAAMQYDNDQHGFDLRAYVIKKRLDEYDIFRCINWIREQVKAGVKPMQLIQSLEAVDGVPWRGNDDYLKPTLEDDALLFHDYEDLVSKWRWEQLRCYKHRFPRAFIYTLCQSWNVNNKLLVML